MHHKYVFMYFYQRYQDLLYGITRGAIWELYSIKSNYDKIENTAPNGSIFYDT